MAEKSYFFNDENDDRVYLAEDFAMFFSTLIANGVFPIPSTNLQVLVNEETPMAITIKPGKAWINGYLYWNPDNLVKTLEPAYANPRIDRIVVRWVSNIRDIKAYIVTGTPAAVPVAPELTRNSDVWELAIADIFVGGGVTSVTQANITDTRLSNDLCGIVHALVQQVPTETIFNQYLGWFEEMKASNQTDFDEWFTSLQETLDENVAANLLAMINNLSADSAVHTTAISNLKKFQTAGGTATAIELTSVELTDGFQTTFIIANSNSGAATTINAKPLYKPGTTTAPKLVAGKAATVWYKLAGDCFFIKASSEGDATAANVLAGKTFSNDDDTGITGAMPNRGAVTITPGIANQAILDGFHNGSGYVAGDADLVASNILQGKNIFGVTGNVYEPATTAAYSLMTNFGGTDYPFGINQSETFCQSEVQQLTYKKYGQRINMKASGTVRIKFTLVPTLVNYLGQVFARIYKNGAPLGLERASILNNMSNQTFMEDFTVSKGDYLEFYLKTSNNAGAYGKVTSLLLGFNKESLIALV